jgi:hypothetical protein
VGDRGIICANDISEKGLDTLIDPFSRQGVDKITTVLGEIEDALFPGLAILGGEAVVSDMTRNGRRRLELMSTD